MKDFMSNNNNSLKNKKIIFFDGVCSLCNGFISFVISRNKGRKLFIATLQGQTAKKVLPKNLTEDLGTVAFYKNGVIYTRSTAVIEVFCTLGGFLKVFFAAYIMPRFLRDLLYNFIAERRYIFFGKKSTCRLPSTEEKTYFLD